MAKIPVALQLYTVRDQLANDFAGTVRKVAEMGYAGVEFAGTGDLEAEAMCDLLTETGLKPAGYHAGMDAIESEFRSLMRYNQVIGNTRVGLSALPQSHRNPAGYRKAAQFLNKYGAAFQEAGIELYYHNHAFEFEPYEGTYGLEVLYGETNPELVKLEVDVYWVAYGGHDPAALIEANGGRCPLIHLKDMTGEGDERTFTEVGNGTIDFEPVFTASEAGGAVWYIVEQDRCAGPSLVSAKASLDNLIKWGKA